MSSDDNIFLATGKPLREVAGWLAEALSLEPVENPDLKDDAFLCRGRARSVSGDLFVVLEPNVYGEAGGDWLVEVVGAEVVAVGEEAVRLRMRGTTGDGWFGVVVQPNGYVAPDPEPDEVQAMDRYAIEVQVRGGSDDALHREAGRLFDALTTDRSDVPALLVHNLETLVSAYLPGIGRHTFNPQITPDVDDIDVWRAWVVG